MGTALEHPQTVPFLGGRDRAEKYLVKHETVLGKNIGVWHSGDLTDVSVGRLLFVGDDGYSLGLCGNSDLDGSARFAGVRRGNAAEGGAPQNARPLREPSLDEILRYSGRFVPRACMTEFEQGLRAMYAKQMQRYADGLPSI